MDDFNPPSMIAKDLVKPLTPEEERFVQEFVDRSGQTAQTQNAALAAGLSPSDNKNSCRARGNELRKRPYIHQAIINEGLNRIHHVASGVHLVLAELLHCNDSKVRMEACKMLTERTHGSIVRKSANLSKQVTDDNLDQADLVKWCDEYDASPEGKSANAFRKDMETISYLNGLPLTERALQIREDPEAHQKLMDRLPTAVRVEFERNNPLDDDGTIEDVTFYEIHDEEEQAEEPEPEGLTALERFKLRRRLADAADEYADG